MAEVEAVKEVKAKRAIKKALVSVVVGSVDNTLADVLKYAEEGREIYFADRTNFLEVPAQVVELMTIGSRERYGLAKRITNGEDVVGSMMDAERGWAKDYQVRPGAFATNTEVFGKDSNKDYYLATPMKISGHTAKGWEIDHDSDVHMFSKESGTLKTVGGEKHPELVLMSRPKSVGIERKLERATKHRRTIQKTKENFVEKAASKGVIAKID